MIQELIPLLGNPPVDLKFFVEVCAALSLLGLGLWLAGARFSRGIVTLCGVTIGALAGKHSPTFVPQLTPFSAPVLAIGGALILGVICFISHRFWIGLALGTVLACWASLGTWALMHGQAAWSPPVWNADMDVSRLAMDFWSGLPSEVTRIAPYAAGAAMISGIAMAILWPRVATALNWSLAGMSLVLCAGLAAVEFTRPQWMSALPAQTSSQIAAFVGLVVFGALVQWKLSPQVIAKKVAKAATSKSDAS